MLTCGASNYYPVVPVSSTQNIKHSHRNRTQYPVQCPKKTESSVHTDRKDMVPMLVTNYNVGTQAARLVEKKGVGTTGCCWRHSEVVSSLWCALATYCGVLWCTVVYLGGILWCTCLPTVVYLSTYCGVPVLNLVHCGIHSGIHSVMYLAQHCGVPRSLHRPEL